MGENNGTTNTTKDEKAYSKKVIYVAEEANEMGHDIDLDGLVGRIEMLEQFNFDNT